MPSEFVYQNFSPRLEEILQSIDRPGEFCTFGRVSEPMPRLEVENVGVLSFPVPEAQIEELIRIAVPAPYGKGSQTLVDSSVRNCWELNMDRFSLGGQSWNKTVDCLRRLAADGLGCPHKHLSAQLYKLLVYPTGGFFVSHRDTEKSDGMIATLTISLPVEGTGGELSVRHKDKEMTVEMNVNDPSELAYAAFYADCQHEIKEVRSGHRVALVYNLCLEQGDFEMFQDAPDYTVEVDEIVKELHSWCNKEKTANKLVWILAHQYSQVGLSFSTLKNGDRALANALRLASERADCELYASIVNIYESYVAWYVGDGGYYYEYEEPGPEDFEYDELIDAEVWMDSWVSPNGSSPNFGKLSINEYEPMPAGVLDDAVPDDERIEEATGNEGATLERAYHFAALVLFRREKMLDELVKRGASPGVAWIAEELSRNDGIVDGRIIRLAGKLIDIWPAVDYDFREQESISEMLLLLLKLSDQRTSMRFLREIVVDNYKDATNDELATILCSLDPVWIEDILLSLIRKKFASLPEKLLQLLMLLERAIEQSSLSKQRIFITCAAEILLLLPEALSRMSELSRTQTYGKPKRSKFRKNAIKDLVKLYWNANAMDDVISISGMFKKFPAVASLDREMPKAVSELRKMDGIFHAEGFSSLWCISADYLLERSGTPPESPKDWKIPFDNCCHCPHCSKLLDFCEDPEQSVARFSLKKDLRAHLHQIIDANRLDLNHVTERKGRPYTLVCTKNRATYKRRLKEYAKDIQHMHTLAKAMTGAKLTTQVKVQYAKLQNAISHSKLLD